MAGVARRSGGHNRLVWSSTRCAAASDATGTSISSTISARGCARSWRCGGTGRQGTHADRVCLRRCVRLEGRLDSSRVGHGEPVRARTHAGLDRQGQARAGEPGSTQDDQLALSRPAAPICLHAIGERGGPARRARVPRARCHQHDVSVSAIDAAQTGARAGSSTRTSASASMSAFTTLRRGTSCRSKRRFRLRLVCR